jgi:tryptophanase
VSKSEIPLNVSALPNLPEPWRVKTVEPIVLRDREHRERRLREAAFNVFQVPSEDVYIDLFTDSGTSAMSDSQWAGMMLGDEAYAGSKNFYSLQAAVQSIFRFPVVLPVHQGRAAENLLFSTLVKRGDIIPNNSHFDTTRANIEMNGGAALDLLAAGGYDPSLEHPFKGNIDLERVEALFRSTSRGKIPLAMLTLTNNAGGGQPVSLNNIRGMAALCHDFGIPFYIDAARFAENAWFIKQREAGQQNRSVIDIVHDIFSVADGCLMSAKKDGLSNIGGFIASRDVDLMESLKQRMLVIEGFPTYGGLAGRDLEAISRGLREVLDENYLRFRVGQVEQFGSRLTSLGIPILRPVGGHAVYVDAKTLLSHIPQSQFPAQALVVALYREGGVRSVEIGTVMFGRDQPKDGETAVAPMELVRLAVPRRVYTTSHLQYVAEVLGEIAAHRTRLKGLRFTYRAPVLRHFTARFEEID